MLDITNRKTPVAKTSWTKGTNNTKSETSRIITDASFSDNYTLKLCVCVCVCVCACVHACVRVYGGTDLPDLIHLHNNHTKVQLDRIKTY